MFDSVAWEVQLINHIVGPSNLQRSGNNRRVCTTRASVYNAKTLGLRASWETPERHLFANNHRAAWTEC